mmetsp:Transcript_1650/g.3955  ORF Transcript_1650/g.3955 Transcript_1650/m.3955 type:complete len:193 (-) Transcript_1650:353-931(-)
MFGKILWEQTQNALKGSLELGVATAQFAGLMHCVREYLFDITLCSGPSMLPALGVQGNVVMLESVTPRMQRIRVGDVVIASSPNNPANSVCKRVCGLAGDVVEVLPSHSLQKVRHEVVPPGHVWLQGDNLHNSTDSRTYGAVPIGLVRGRVFCKIWPLSEARVFRTDPTCCSGRGGAVSKQPEESVSLSEGE